MTINVRGKTNTTTTPRASQANRPKIIIAELVVVTSQRNRGEEEVEVKSPKRLDKQVQLIVISLR